MTYYRVDVSTPHRKRLTVIVNAANADDAGIDARAALQVFAKCHPALVTVKCISKTRKSSVASATPIKGCSTGGQQWAWIA